jgi:membrane dipeptidase
MIIVDGHQDIAWNYFQNRRDFRRSAHDQRRRETDPVHLRRYGRCMVGLPEALEAHVAVMVVSIFVSPSDRKMYPDETILYDTPEEACRLGTQQLDYYHRLAEQDEQIQLILAQRDLDAVLATWEEDRLEEDHRIGLVISMEGADPILEPAEIEKWRARGLRAVGPAWSATRYSGGTKAPGPLTDLGRELLASMREFGMILDLAHMDPNACLEALDRYDGPLYASHANPLRFRQDRVDRNLSDTIIQLIAERDGVVGIMPYNLFLIEGWERGDRKEAASMANVVAAIDHVCQLTGSARHVGIGSDFDGGFGSESAPEDFDTIADLRQIEPALTARGYPPEDIEAVLSGNFLRVLRAGLPAE